MRFPSGFQEMACDGVHVPHKNQDLFTDRPLEQDDWGWERPEANYHAFVTYNEGTGFPPGCYIGRRGGKEDLVRSLGGQNLTVMMRNGMMTTSYHLDISPKQVQDLSAP